MNSILNILKVIKTTGKLIDTIADLSLYVGWISLGLLAGDLTLSAIARYVFNSPIGWTDQIAQVLMIPLIIIPMAYVFKRGSHVKVDLATRRLPPIVQKYLQRFVELLTLLLFVIITKEFYKQMIICMAQDRRFATIWSWPLWPVRAIGILGLSLVIIYFIKEFLMNLYMMFYRKSVG